MKNKANTIIIYLLILCGCSHEKSFYEVKDNTLTLQIIKMGINPQDHNITSYQARLIPGKDFITEEGYQQKKTKLWYQMDSCFYLQNGSNKIYPVLVQPIANGVSDSYEYMIEFEKGNIENSAWQLVYQDKYISQKRYDLKLNKD